MSPLLQANVAVRFRRMAEVPARLHIASFGQSVYLEQLLMAPVHPGPAAAVWTGCGWS
jgi:hypothetical protein